MSLSSQEGVRQVNAIALPAPREVLKRAISATGRPAWQIGHMAGISATVLSHLCTGRRDPTEEEARRLADVLETDVHELFPEGR
jgi:hypothetical protein